LHCVAVCSVCYAHLVRYTDPICVAVCCSVLRCIAVRCSVFSVSRTPRPIHWPDICCSVLQHVAACCSMLQCVAVCCAHLVRHAVPIRRGERILAFADLLEEHRCGIVIKWREPAQHDVQHHTCVRVCVRVMFVCVCVESLEDGVEP